MNLNFAAIDAALISALPILAVTAYPVLAITSGVAWWLRDQLADDALNVDDYREPAATPAPVRRARPVDAPTQVIPRVLPDAGTPVYDQLAARRAARQVLAELGQRARTGATA